MSELVELVDLQKKFKRNTKAYTRKSMLQYIHVDLKSVGDYPKKWRR